MLARNETTMHQLHIIMTLVPKAVVDSVLPFFFVTKYKYIHSFY